jgi:hypothetical protein
VVTSPIRLHEILERDSESKGRRDQLSRQVKRHDLLFVPHPQDRDSFALRMPGIVPVCSGIQSSEEVRTTA